MNQSKFSAFVRSYWDYYLELEEQFLNTKKYIAFDMFNKNAYSVEFLKLIQAVCSEIDVVAKEIASALEPSFKVDKSTNIQKWGYIIQNKLPIILKDEVIFDHGIRVYPWKNWLYEQFRDGNNALRYRLKGKAETPPWWKAYTDIKHQRTRVAKNGETNFTKANLINTINCFAALYVLETEYMATMNGKQEPINGIDNSKLFQLFQKQFPDLIY